jgi:hypothetical protein
VPHRHPGRHRLPPEIPQRELPVTSWPRINTDSHGSEQSTRLSVAQLLFDFLRDLAA